MPVLKADSVTKALKKKGFFEGSGKHVVYQFFADGEDTPVFTHVSHNKQEIDSFLQSRMANQLHLSKQEFIDMVSCKIGYDELVRKYIELNLIQAKK